MDQLLCRQAQVAEQLVWFVCSERKMLESWSETRTKSYIIANFCSSDSRFDQCKSRDYQVEQLRKTFVYKTWKRHPNSPTSIQGSHGGSLWLSALCWNAFIRQGSLSSSKARAKYYMQITTQPCPPVVFQQNIYNASHSCFFHGKYKKFRPKLPHMIRCRNNKLLLDT